VFGQAERQRPFPPVGVLDETIMASKQQRETASRKSGRKMSARPAVPKYNPKAAPIWEVAERLAAEVPNSEWENVPRDLARNVHHYLHGRVKEDGE
jgi:signal recognition particle subunit SEC65